MMRSIAMILVSGLLLAADPVVRTGDNGDDVQKLQGTWRGVALEIKGDLLPPTSARTLWFHFEKDTFTIRQEGKITVEGSYTLDSSRKPKTIDLTITETVQAVNKGALVQGIYKLEKDRLWLCTTKANGEDRPKKFLSKRDAAHTLFTFQKEKP